MGGVGKETTQPPCVAVLMWNKHFETVNRLPRTNNTCEGNCPFQEWHFIHNFLALWANFLPLPSGYACLFASCLTSYSLLTLIYRPNPPWRYSPRVRVARPRQHSTSWTWRRSAAGSAGSAPRLSSSICRTWCGSSAGGPMTHSR